MKRNISLIFSLLFIFSACQKEEVEEYVSGARLNFNNDYKVENVPTIRCSFTDSDYLNKTTEITDSIEVVVMGLSTNTDRTFYCRIIYYPQEYVQHLYQILNQSPR